MFDIKGLFQNDRRMVKGAIAGVASGLAVSAIWFWFLSSITAHHEQVNANFHINYTPAPVAVAKPPAPVYAPPCVKDATAGCGDRVYGKRLLEGTVDTVAFHSSEPVLSGSAGDDQHLRPDYTEVTLAPLDDQAQELTEKFCGNVLDQFNPGQHVKRIIKESVLSDYNDCYTVYPVELTFGGKRTSSTLQTSKVPGVYMTPGDVQALKDCEHTDGGTCGL